MATDRAADGLDEARPSRGVTVGGRAPARPQPIWPPRGLLLVGIYTLTTFLSALLLFSIQPLFAKMVLPLLGGSPSVWAVALCFFQGALLAGYGLAFVLNRFLPATRSGFVHLAGFALAICALPIGLPRAWREPPPGDPTMWQLGLFCVAVGLPFVVVAANAPLLQAWFARTGHRDSRDPYFLYGASNLGSFCALIAYPLVLEPLFGLTALARLWTIGFVLLAFAVAVCFLAMRARAAAGRPLETPDTPLSEIETAGAGARIDGADEPANGEPTWRSRASWVGLAMVPSALLTAFTTHIATDVASAPLIWVGPLALYLLTFVLVFRARPLAFLPCAVATAAAGYILVKYDAQRLLGTGVELATWAPWAGAAGATALFGLAYFYRLMRPVSWLLAFHLAAVILALLQLSQTRHDTWFISAATGVAAFFLSTLVAHRTLYEARPAASHLTEFYLWMSFGGVLGGLFSALAAPRMFSEVLEYPILLSLTMACRPGALAVSFRRLDDVLWLWFIAAAGGLAVWWSQLFGWEERLRDAAFFLASHVTWLDLGRHLSVTLRAIAGYGMATTLTMAFALATIAFVRHPARQLVATLAMCLAVVMLPSSVKRGDARRSYFGVYRVSEPDDHAFKVLTHGTTLHGAQRIRDADGKRVLDTTPGTYYHPESPMAKTVELVREQALAEGRPGRYGIVGVGTGSMACHSKPGEAWRFFEIDPLIIRMATDPDIFSFITHCQPDFDYVLGDARLTIAREPAGSFDLILVDAFSSDAIPVHLMTAEAMRLYAEKLAPDGILLLHISNRYLDLESVLAGTLPKVAGLDGLILSEDADESCSYDCSSSTVGVFSKSTAALEPFRKLDMAHEFGKTLRGWTDDYSDILGPFLARLQ